MQEKELYILIWTKIKNNISTIVQLIAIFFTFFTAAISVSQCLQNYLKSIYFQVDYSLFRVEFNIYSILLLYFVFLICTLFTKSIIQICSYVWCKIRKKKTKILSKNCIYLTIIIFSIYIFLFVILNDFKTITLLFIETLSIGFICLYIFLIWKKKDNASNLNFSISSYLIHFLYQLIIIFMLIIIVNFISCWLQYSFNKNYYILNFDDHIEVVIEQYSDYYIVKTGKIDSNNLYIDMYSQGIRSTKDNIANKVNFNKILFK